MFKFGKKKRYTIGEKISYFNSLIKNPNTSSKKKQWAKGRKQDLNKKKNNIKLGDVFIVDDHLMGNPRHKPRNVVVAKVNGDKVSVIPVKKTNKIMTLKNFDGNRLINYREVKSISKYRLFEKRGFKVAKNAKLNPSEKTILLNKTKKYLP